MSYTIKNRWTGEALYVAKGASDVREALQEAVKARANLAGANLAGAYLAGADLAHADLARANLAGADLAGAYLAGADLAGADLAHADLARANLAGANLAHANLARAKGLAPERVNDLLILQHQVGKVRAFKLVTAGGVGPRYGGLIYEVGKTAEVENPNTDPNVQCAPGVNLATLPWCLRNWREGYRILVCEFTAADIAAIPTGDGKFRVAKAKVVKEIPEAQIREWLSLEGLEAA